MHHIGQVKPPLISNLKNTNIMLSRTTTPPTPDTPKPATTPVMAPTYLEQERHMHEQYIAGKVEPMNHRYCFCGNLLGPRVGHTLTFADRYWPTAYYTRGELSKMEYALFEGIRKATGSHVSDDHVYHHPAYETGLFNGMVGALEVLKEIHRGRGEVVDAPVSFTRRPQASHA